MAFKDIQKGVTRRFTALKGAAEFSRTVIKIVNALYPKKGKNPLITQVVHEVSARRIKLQPSTKLVAARLVKDRGLIRAALRREGLDIKEVIIKRINDHLA